MTQDWSSHPIWVYFAINDSHLTFISGDTITSGQPRQTAIYD